MAQLLLDRGAHVDWRDTMGDSALHYAAERGNLDFIRFLIAHGATVDFPNKQGTTPIMVAADHAQPAAVRLLLKSGADPKKQDFTGRDAYGWAAGKPAVVQALNAAR
jgi:ankyrin repeat protein